MKITSIKQQVKNPERVSIYIDGKYSFSLSLDELLVERLKVGHEIDETKLKVLQKVSADGKLKMRTLNWVLLRPHSTKELQDYLRRKKAEADQITLLTSYFTDKKYINDASFAKWWVETRRSSKKSSSKKLRLELMQKGISREIIDDILSDSQDDERTALKELIEKKAKLSRYQDHTKLVQYLQRQGFRYADILDAIENT